MTQTTLKEKKMMVKATLNWKKILSAAIIVLGTSWVSGIILNILGLQNNYVLRLLIMLAIYRSLKFVMKEKYVYLLVAFTVLRVLLEYKSMFTLQFLISETIFIAIFLIGGGFVSQVGETRKKDITLKDLKAGMFIWQTVKKDEELFAEKKQKEQEWKDKTELVEDDITEIKKKMRAEKKFSITVSDTLPSAIFITLAAFITLMVQGNMVFFLRALLF